MGRLVLLVFAFIWVLLLAASAFDVYRGKLITDPAFVTELTMLALYSVAAARHSTRLIAIVVTASFVTPLYAFELYLNISGRAASGPPIVNKVAELREQGSLVYFTVPRWDYFRLHGDQISPIVLRDRRILPLSGIPNVPTLYCTNDDGWIIFKSDDLGFRNPKESNPTAALDIALLGDSFVKGYCVPSEFTYANLLAELGPARSFGMDDTSVLAQYAIYREFVQDRKPKHVIWFFYAGNDLTDFWVENRSSALAPYRAPDHFQGLAENALSIGNQIKTYIDDYLLAQGSEGVTDNGATKPPASRQPQTPLGQRLREFATLQKTQLRIFFPPEPLPRGAGDLAPNDWEVMATIWQRVVDQQTRHGGDVTFVYLPDARRYLTDNPKPFTDLEKRILDKWSALGARHMSVSDMLRETEDPLRYYDKERIHFTREGYVKSAAYIVRMIAGNIDRPANRR